MHDGRSGMNVCMDVQKLVNDGGRCMYAACMYACMYGGMASTQTAKTANKTHKPLVCLT